MTLNGFKMSVVQKCYKIVANLNDVLHKYGFDHSDDKELLEFTCKTLIATNVAYDEIAKAVASKAIYSKSYREFLRDYMEWHRRKASQSQSQLLVHSPSVLRYLQSECIKKLRQLVGGVFFEYLLFNFDIYEQLCGSKTCYTQKFGFVLSRHAWLKTVFESNCKAVKNENLQECLRLVNLKANVGKLCNLIDEEFPPEHKCVLHEEKSFEIRRRTMFYSEAIRGNWQRNPLFFTNKKAITAKDLFHTIFNSQQQLHFNDSKSVVADLQKIIEKHKFCKYRNLLDFACKTDLAQICDKGTLKYRSSQFEVCQFIRLVFRLVFPSSLFGGQSGHRKIYNGLKLLVKTGVKVTLKLSNIRGANFDVSKCKWLNCVPCECKKLSVFDSLLKWITNYFINLLKSHFYITETGVTKMETCFFRHDVWRKLCENEINSLQSENRITEIDFQDTHGNSIEVFTLRFLPKSRGFRKLVYSRKCTTTSEMRSTMKNLLSALREIRQLNNWKNANSGQLHKTVKSLKIAQPKKVYWLRADISQCFSSIDQHRLLYVVYQQIDKLFAKYDSLTFKECEMVTSSGNRLISKRIRYIAESMSSFYESVCNKDCVIIESKYEKRVAVELIKEHLADYIVAPVLKSRETGKFYVMKKGIREGGTLSSELCALFVNSMLEECFGDLGCGQFEDRLIQTDDIVFMTCDESRYKKAVNILTNGFGDWGIRINEEKLVFNPEVNGYRFSEELLFDGRLLNAETLNCRTDYSHYANQQVDYSFSCNPFASIADIRIKIISHVAVNISYIDIDCDTNSQLTVALNLYEKFTLQSYRLLAFFKTSPICSSQQNQKFVLKLAFFLSRRVWMVATKWCDRSLIKCSLSEADIQCICLKAMKDVWATGASNRGDELRVLKESFAIISKKVSTNNFQAWMSKFGSDINPAFQHVLFPWK